MICYDMSCCDVICHIVLCQIIDAIFLPLNYSLLFNYLYSNLTQMLLLQLIAYELALMKGINPDVPRNLAKAVTTD